MPSLFVFISNPTHAIISLDELIGGLAIGTF